MRTASFHQIIVVTLVACMAFAAGTAAWARRLPAYFTTAVFSSNTLSVPEDRPVIVLARTARGWYSKFHATPYYMSHFQQYRLSLGSMATWNADGQRKCTADAMILLPNEFVDFDRCRARPPDYARNARWVVHARGNAHLRPVNRTQLAIAFDPATVPRNDAARIAVGSGRIASHKLYDTVLAVKTDQGFYALLMVNVVNHRLVIRYGTVWNTNGSVRHRVPAVALNPIGKMSTVRGGTQGGSDRYRITQKSYLDLDAPGDSAQQNGLEGAEFSWHYQNNPRLYYLQPIGNARVSIYKRF
jgi:hypothetical protein